MDRRMFLAAGMGAQAMAWSGGVLAAGPAGGAKLLVVMLRGAYDSASLLAPVGSGDYYDARPNIALARPGSGPGAALALGGQWGLHPSAGALMDIYKARQVAFVPFCGNPGAPRSHFEAQDLMEAGMAPGARQSRAGSGWMGRLVERVAGAGSGIGAMSFTSNLALSMKGSVAVPNGAAAEIGRAQDPRAARMMRELYQGSALEGIAGQGVDARERVAREMGALAERERAMEPTGRTDQGGAGPMGVYAAEMKAADAGARAAGAALSGQFAKMGKLMGVDPKASIGFVDVGGWDTHVAQGGASGQLATRLGALSDALGAYAGALGPAWRDAGVLVLSEFGRAFRENGNRGTDTATERRSGSWAGESGAVGWLGGRRLWAMEASTRRATSKCSTTTAAWPRR